MNRVEGLTTSLRKEYHEQDSNHSVSEQEQVAEDIEVSDSYMIYYAVFGLRLSS